MLTLLMIHNKALLSNSNNMLVLFLVAFSVFSVASHNQRIPHGSGAVNAVTKIDQETIENEIWPKQLIVTLSVSERVSELHPS